MKMELMFGGGGVLIRFWPANRLAGKPGPPAELRPGGKLGYDKYGLEREPAESWWG